MPAEIDFSPRREPPQTIRSGILYGKGCFRKVVFDGNQLHQLVREPSVQYADRRGIAFK